MKVIAKKFRGVWHYGVITSVVTEWVLEIYGGATQWRAVFEDGDTVDLLRSEVVEAMAAAQEHSPVDADGEARLATVPEGDDQSSESEEEGWEGGGGGGGDAAGAGWTSEEEEEEEAAHLRAWESADVPGSDTNALTFAVMKCSAHVKSKNFNNSADSDWQLLDDIMPAGFTWGGMAVPRSHKAMRKFLRVRDTSRYVRHMCPKECVAFSGAPGKAGGWANLPDQHCPECNADRGRPDAKVRKLMAASSTAPPPGVVKTLTDDKKRKRPVKKRRGKKLTVVESEAESEAQAEAEAEAEAEAARSSKRRVPRARKNKNKQ
eukprot:jgi/Tetstr1/461213/TSEL_006350.t1